MTKNEAITLYKFLAVTFPRQYGNLSDAELPIVIDNLAWAYRFNPLDEVLLEYRKAFTHSKTAPHPSEVLQNLTPHIQYAPTKARITHEQRILMPEYQALVRKYGEDLVEEHEHCCYVDGSIAELTWWIERTVFYTRFGSKWYLDRYGDRLKDII